MMSILLNCEEGKNGFTDFTIPIASTRFFLEFWDRAIVELGLVFIQENASFRKENLNDVLAELALLNGISI